MYDQCILPVMTYNRRTKFNKNNGVQIASYPKSNKDNNVKDGFKDVKQCSLWTLNVLQKIETQQYNTNQTLLQNFMQTS